MKIKSILTTFAIIISLGFGSLFTGCKEGSNILDDSLKVAQIASVLKAGTTISVAAVLINNPDSSRYFKSAALGIRAAIGAKELTPEDIMENIEFYTDSGTGKYSGIVSGALGLALSAYGSFYIQNIEGEIDDHLVILLTAIADGISYGLLEPVAASSARASSPEPNPITTLSVSRLTL